MIIRLSPVEPELGALTRRRAPFQGHIQTEERQSAGPGKGREGSQCETTVRSV